MPRCARRECPIRQVLLRRRGAAAAPEMALLAPRAKPCVRLGPNRAAGGDIAPAESAAGSRNYASFHLADIRELAARFARLPLPAPRPSSRPRAAWRSGSAFAATANYAAALRQKRPAPRPPGASRAGLRPAPLRPLVRRAQR